MKSPLSEFVSSTVGNISGAALMIATVTLFSLWVILGNDKFVDFIVWALN